MRGLMGTFAVMPLQEVVEFLARRRASGSLTCERGTVRKTVFLDQGVMVGCSTNDSREFLGRLLLNFGHVTEEQLAKALETQEETRVRLGKVLAMVGVVSPEVIRETLALQLREALLDAFVWDSGVFRVDDVPPPPGDDLDARVPLDEIAREAEFRTTAWRAFRTQFPTGTATLRVNEAAVPAGLPPGGVDARLLELARGGNTIDEIGLALHSTDFHLYQRLYALNRQGVVEAAPVLAPLQPAEAERPAPEGEVTLQLRASLLDPPCRPRLKVSGHEVGLMRLSAAEKYLLGRCDGQRDLRQIIELAPLGEADVLRAVKRFVDARLLELA
jgi:hypothetical protein